MASPSSPTPHPRRVLVTGLGLKTTLLNKGATFHSPTSHIEETSSFFPPHLSRAQSNLDDVNDAHRRRVAMTLDSISKRLSNIHLSEDAPSSSSSSSFFTDGGPVPQGILSRTIIRPPPSPPSPSERRTLQPRSVNRNRRHASDSGLGSSIASSSSVKTHYQADKATRSKTSSAVQATAVTRSAAAASTMGVKHAGLSPRATNRIYEHTVKPLLAKPTFKPFHPILLECTSKINKKDIVCLRDLEKTILFLAPERTKVAKLYLAFCLESVRCLQATVEYLSDREQTRPSDAPYTAGYFIDLVDQIHHYAQQLADTKEKEKSGVNMDTMDFHSTDQIKLHGGIAVNGRPAELVRVSRDGRAVSIATGLPVELEEDTKDTIRIKRSASQEREDEEEIMRSMARRKKNAPPEEYAPKMCSVPGCTKEFKRPCDLTKHEKTHSRPWKCPLPSCKYHDYGWPTEKEKDRHLNDKHSDNPPMYECLYKPCTYKSKRDSNRKQHMEKTHGWKYIRTKTNGSNKLQSPVDMAQQPQSASSHSTGRPSLDAGSSTNQPTPQLVNMPTPVSTMSPNIATPPLDDFSAPLFDNALAQLNFPTCAPSDIMGGMNMPTEINDLDLDFTSLDTDNSGFGGMDNLGNEAAAYASPSNASSLDNNSAYQDIGQDTTMFEDIYSAPMQLPMSESAVFSNNYSTDKGLLDQFLAAAELCVPMVTPEQQQQIARMQMAREQARQQQQQQQQQQQVADLLARFSPLGEGNTMLYTPDSLVEDDGFADMQGDSSKKGLDFVLFPPAQLGLAKTTGSAFDNTFADMTPSLAAGYSQPTSQIYPNMDW